MSSVIIMPIRTVNIAADHLAPVVPSRGDKVKVILGDEDKEQTGQLLSIDSQVLVMVAMFSSNGGDLCFRRGWSSWTTAGT